MPEIQLPNVGLRGHGNLGAVSVFTFWSGVYKSVYEPIRGAGAPPILLQDISWIMRRNFIASKTNVCKKERFTLTAGGDTSRISSYQWRLGNGAWFPGSKVLDTFFTTNGNQSVALIITNKYGGCTDTATMTGLINVVGPVAGFVPAAADLSKQFGKLTDQDRVNSNYFKWDMGFWRQHYRDSADLWQPSCTGTYTVK